MAIALDPNQGNIYRHGTWIWRTGLAITDAAAAARHALFSLPTGCRILGGVVDVTTAETGTTLTADLSLENNGGDVDLATGINLKSAGRTSIDTADEGVKTAHNASGDPVDVVLDIATSSAPNGDAVITVGLFVAREDYDKAN